MNEPESAAASWKLEHMDMRYFVSILDTHHFDHVALFSFV